MSVVVCLFQPRLYCPVEVKRCHFGTADMCVTTQTDLYLGVAHGWDIPAWWPLDASTWMLGIIPYSVFLSYMVRWVASLGRIADSHLQNFSPSISVPGCCVCCRLFVLSVYVISCVRREGRIQWRTLISFSMGFLDKDKAPLFLPPPRTRTTLPSSPSYSDYSSVEMMTYLRLNFPNTVL